MSLALLQGPKDWQEFQVAMAKFAGNLGLEFNSKPEEYPCMVDSIFVTGMPALCCFMYKEDAARLLRSLPTFQAATQPQPTPAAKPAESVEHKQTTVTECISPVQEENARRVAALLLTIINLLVETGIVKEDEFERRLYDSTRQVDEIVTEQKDEQKIDSEVNQSAEKLLRRLGMLPDQPEPE